MLKYLSKKIEFGDQMLELKNITYEAEKIENGKKVNLTILKNVSLKIANGETVVITGPNGSGKSTLAKLIMGIIKPTSGKILFEGKDITNATIFERAKLGIGFAFQQPVKFKGLTVEELLSLASGGNISIKDACEHLSDVGLCARDYIKREINSSLSGGELKRIEIASVAARKAKLSIFDEPEAGIDLWSFNSLIDAFSKLKQKCNGATIIISHQEKLISVADRLVVLTSGQITSQGNPTNILKQVTFGKTTCTKLGG